MTAPYRHQNCYEKQYPQHQSTVTIGTAAFGGAEIPIIAGPCSVESFEQLLETSEAIQNLGISCLRGGAFKPRSSPYSFQGLGEEGLKLLSAMRLQFGLGIVSEVMTPEQIPLAEAYVDCFQVGSRNMQNFELLKALGRHSKPVLLKRGLAATLDEFLMAAEYILSEGNPNVILCERGIRSFDPATRNVFDVVSIALLKQRTHLPVIADPSHATGRRDLIEPATLAAIAAGADGIILEAHPHPHKSVSDADQAISLSDLAALVPKMKAVANAVNRNVSLAVEGVLH